MPNSLVHELRRYTPLSHEDTALLGAECQAVREVPAQPTPWTADHTLATLTSTRVAALQRRRSRKVAQSRAALVQAFHFHQLVCQGTLIARIINTARYNSMTNFCSGIRSIFVPKTAAGS